MVDVTRPVSLDKLQFETLLTAISAAGGGGLTPEQDAKLTAIFDKLGPLQTLLDTLDSRTRDIDITVDTIEATTNTIGAVVNRVEAQTNTIPALTNKLNSVSDTVGDVDDRTRNMYVAIDNTRSVVDATKVQVEATRGQVGNIQTALVNLDRQVKDGNLCTGFRCINDNTTGIVSTFSNFAGNFELSTVNVHSPLGNTDLGDMNMERGGGRL